MSARGSQWAVSMQILLDDPSQDNYIVIPDNSGIFVIEALEPLFIDTSGTVYLEQDLIVHVGQLVAGSIGRSFGTPALLTQSCLHSPAYIVLLTQSCLHSPAYIVLLTQSCLHSPAYTVLLTQSCSHSGSDVGCMC